MPINKELIEEYKLVPMDEITEEAKAIAVLWVEGYKPMGFDLPQKHKLASDIMNYAKNYHIALATTSIKQMKEPIELTPEDMANRILRRDQLIMSIQVNKGNFQHIIKTGKINGSLYDSISNLLITETHLANIKRSIAEKQLESKDARIKELEAAIDGN